MDNQEETDLTNELLIEAIENAIIVAVNAGHAKEDIEHAISELWDAI